MPNDEDRMEIFKLYTGENGIRIARDVNLVDLVEMTDGWTCADIVVFIR